MKKNSTSIGGQAVLEGVMMRGRESIATAVRDPKGEIQVENYRIKRSPAMKRILKIPVLRGVVAFVDSMLTGIKTLTRASEVYGGIEEEQPSRFEKWLAEKLRIDIMDVVTFIGLLLGVGLSVFLFVFLPQIIVETFKIDDIHVILKNLVAGGVRIAIFVIYILLTSFVKDIKRLYRYHGAEHKVITCYEKGLDLTVENARKMTTVHDRCGTTFMVIVMVFSIIFFSFFGWPELWLRILTRVLCLPLVAGLSYELLKFFAKYDNFFTRICKFPGLLMQKLTTAEPDDGMLEVALTAFQTVLDMDEDRLTEEKKFVTYAVYAKAKEHLKKVKADDEIIDYVLLAVTGLKTKTELIAGRVSNAQLDRAENALKEYVSGKPIQYALGEAPFYGFNVKVTPEVLIPRFDTELAAEYAINTVKERGYRTVLDLCTGSGAIAIAIAKNTDAQVCASDISENALTVARENAAALNAEIEFIQSDLFENISGKFDLIISNPPYIPTAELATLDGAVKDYEPMLALDGGADGLDFYRAIQRGYLNRLNEGGTLVLELGKGQYEAVSALFGGAEFINDYNTPPIKRVCIVKAK